MKIRLKIKHLVLVLGATALFIPLLYYIIIPRLELSAAERQFKQGSIQGKEQMIKAIDHPVSDRSKWELIRKYMIEQDFNTLDSRFDVYIGPGSTQVNGAEQSRQSFNESEKLPYLEDYIKNGPADSYLVRAAKQAAQYYSSIGQFNEAIEIINQAVKRLSDIHVVDRRELKLEQAKLFADHGQLEQANQLIDELMANADSSQWNDFIAKVIQLQVQILIAQGNYQEALDIVNSELQTYEQHWSSITRELPDKAPGTPVVLDTLTSLRDLIKNSIQDNNDHPSGSVVVGTVKRSDGTPMPRVGVFLRQQADVYHSVLDGEPYQTVTDASGSFQFKGVLPGNYQLYLGLSLEQIDGWTWPVQYDEWMTITGNEHVIQDVTLQRLLEVITPVNQQVITDNSVEFRWEKVEGAAYYQLNGTIPLDNGSIGTVIQQNIKNNHIRLSVDQLYHLSSGPSFRETRDFSSIVPSSLLGFADTNNRFSWSVEAYDANDRLITRSNGYRLNDNTIGNLPFFYLKERTMTAADQLVLEGRHEEALNAYQQQAKSNPSDIHSLRMAIRLLQARAVVMNDHQYEDEAVPLLEQMMKLAPSEKYAFDLVYYYYKREQWTAYNQAYLDYVNLLAAEVNPYTQALHATALMKQDQFDQAYKQFESAIPRDRSHRFIGNFVAVDLYRSSSFESALELAHQYPELTYDSQTRNWAELIRQMQQEAGNSNSYMSELREKLEWVFHSDTQQLDDWKSRTNLIHMKSFIDHLLQVN